VSTIHPSVISRLTLTIVSGVLTSEQPFLCLSAASATALTPLPSSTSATMSGRGKGKSGKKSVTKSAKAGLQFPVGRIARFLKKVGLAA
jgi:hypothetical protein